MSAGYFEPHNKYWFLNKEREKRLVHCVYIEPLFCKSYVFLFIIWSIVFAFGITSKKRKSNRYLKKNKSEIAAVSEEKKEDMDIFH